MNGYFDYNATTPLHTAASDAWLRASEKHWHNPSSLYRDAGLASHQLESARERLGNLMGAEAERIVFTSGATESNNALFTSLPADAVVVISAIEHPSVREAARGRNVMELPVNAAGVVEVDELKQLIISKRPALVSVMAANNESGALQPWRELAALCREQDVLFHTDAAQWLGKLDAANLGECDFITGSAHKFGGGKGCGFLVLPTEDSRLGFIRGGPQEHGRRAGTENYPAIEAMVTALETVTPRLSEIEHTQSKLRDGFIAALRARFELLRVISESAPRLWNTVLMVMPEHDNLKWLTRLSRRGFSISTGSACSSGKEGSSVVVTALGASAEELKRVVRISGGWDTKVADWQALEAAFFEVFEELNRGGRPQ
ncbi:aminotransferase class V-fold PLP-dependent enzyme [Prosthecobacter sp.]|uniref:cysteine desulfurase family protein n=1 Tax=Prosthecobacter sp. TaxID=1965333 RepID=UPI0024877DEA|nr:aminotransferase class V-fold PLP-dependent enzyme [Prosthecobacter sp.]MDI1311635.1 aminotransferase class V-fold PLP-dependent enzyme [Prosthecobacter sp.]